MRGVAAALLLAAVSGGVQAAGDEITFAGRLSTLGLGIESSTAYWDSVQLRVQGNVGTFDWNASDTGLEADATAELLSAGLLVDFYPLDLLRLSVGAYANKNTIELERRGEGVIEVGANRYQTEANFTLGGDIGFDSMAPYVGIGVGNPLTSKSKLSVNFDVGVMAAGKPTAKLKARGTVTPVDENGDATGPAVEASEDEAFRTDLRAEQDEVASDVESLRFYPVVGLSLAYRF